MEGDSTPNVLDMMRPKGHDDQYSMNGLSYVSAEGASGSISDDMDAKAEASGVPHRTRFDRTYVCTKSHVADLCLIPIDVILLLEKCDTLLKISTSAESSLFGLSRRSYRLTLINIMCQVFLARYGEEIFRAKTIVKRMKRHPFCILHGENVLK